MVQQTNSNLTGGKIPEERLIFEGVVQGNSDRGINYDITHYPFKTVLKLSIAV